MNTLNNHPVKRYLFKIPGKALAATLLFAATVITAATAQERTITIDEAIKLGIENSKTLKMSQSKIDQAVSEYNQAKDKALPTGSASFAYNRAQIPAHTLDLGGGDPIHLPSSANAYLGIASVSETIFAGNRLRYARESTDLLVKVARLDVDKDKEEISYDVINAYYGLYKVLQSKKVVEQNLKTIDAQIKQSQRFFEQGLVTKNDVLRFQLQRANIELNGIDLESNRKIINYNLDILLGLPESTQLNIAQINEADRKMGMLSNYIDTAIANRQELKQSDLRTQAAEVNIKSIMANKAPTLAASVGGYYVDVSGNPIPQSGKFITPITAGLTLSWNFGTLWTNKNKEAEARIQRDQTVIGKDIQLDAIKREVNGNYQNYQTAVNKIKLLQTSIEQAGENNKILENKYQSNIASATDRADAETLLYQAQINLELAKADAGLAYYTLLKSTGKLTK
ncbi:TolC family protein [Mucilaginibacter mali]|uniref:TolC family protein n=1 Tax=Mucilaginibacter mali TaxID=2740462 RepID=A0A7D4UF69_9SPHI|nr:TolC family protein [Mucilaginibacter mali]QKJ32419.1 TolC family protein [Mucilaginibacter mali]